MAKTEKQELDQARKDAVAAFLTGKATYAGSGFSGRLINPGYSGKVTAIDLRELEGVNITPRTKEQGPQMIGGVKVADVGAPSVVLSLIFEDGRSVALATLTNHPDTTIDSTHANKMTGEQWNALIGQTLNCVDRVADDDRQNIRRIPGPDGKSTVQKNAMQKYTFAIA